MKKAWKVKSCFMAADARMKLEDPKKKQANHRRMICLFFEFLLVNSCEIG